MPALEPRTGRIVQNPRSSYYQIWCTAGCSCDGSAVLDELNAVVELDTFDDLGEVSDSSEPSPRSSSHANSTTAGATLFRNRRLFTKAAQLVVELSSSPISLPRN